ncbi:hypothetical protein EU545_05090 [Candidatus Thorarchaeota archaeon]|nr:MAG: hypothetical protein EU545_05090 [Candidatus Thorarchaeota archaeon]
MGIMKAAAVRGLIPAGNKVNELRDNLTRLMAEMGVVLEERFGQEGLDAISEIFRRLGEEDAKNMRERLGLGDTLSDAVDAWKVVGHVMGAKMEAQEISPDRVETTHPFCPQYEAFKDVGKLYCESVCLPYVRAIGEGIGKGVRMEVVRPADEESTCIKALVFTREEAD